jgi:hypothetical protein
MGAENKDKQSEGMCHADTTKNQAVRPVWLKGKPFLFLKDTRHVTRVVVPGKSRKGKIYKKAKDLLPF